MKRMMMSGLLVAAAVGASVLTTAEETAAQDASTMAAHIENEAAVLESEAQSLADKPGWWDYASTLYRDAASLRGAGDQQAVKDLRMAAKLSYYIGRESQAIQDLQSAAESALAGGDVITAANTYIDGAWIAQKTGNSKVARSLADRAERLSQSPLLQTSDRDLVLGRLAAGSTQVVAVAPDFQP